MRPCARLLVPAALVLLAGCTKIVGSSTVQGSGNVVTKQLPAPAAAFGAVSAEGGLDVTVTRGAEASLVVEADDNLIPLLVVKEEGGLLSLSTKDGWSTSHGFTVRVVAPSVTRADASGAVTMSFDVLGAADAATAVNASGGTKVTIGEVVGKSLVVRASGAAKVSAGKGAAAQIDVRAGGGTDVRLTATCDKAVIRAEGSAKVGGAPLRAKDADVITSGAAEVDLDVAETLKADATGASKILFGGEPKVKGTAGAGAKVGPR